MKLMISIVSVAEARDAVEGGAEILDVKNPEEGSLGAQPPQIIREIRRLCPSNVPVSAAIGDMPNLPGTAALAALGAAACGADYIKVGLHGPRDESEALRLLRRVRDAVREYPVSVVAAGYADFRRAGTLDPACLPRIAAAAQAQACLLDTAIKDGCTLFEFIDLQALRDFAEAAHRAGMLFGLAGSLRAQDLETARDLGADVVGLRSAVCRDSERGAPLEKDRVLKLRRALAFQDQSGRIHVPVVTPE
jgi:uncharacterized protein (UPF0264 family)